MIDTIRNNTGGKLELWDGNQKLTTLGQQEAVHNITIVITQVKFDDSIYVREKGSFKNGEGYLAENLNGKEIIFKGSTNKVIFSSLKQAQTSS